jgi:hypothetical protein
MAQVRIKLNLRGFRELRTSPEMDAEILRRARRVAQAAGPGFVAEQSPGVNRARAVVVPDSAEAALETARNPSVLIGALSAGR